MFGALRHPKARIDGILLSRHLSMKSFLRAEIPTVSRFRRQRSAVSRSYMLAIVGTCFSYLSQSHVRNRCRYVTESMLTNKLEVFQRLEMHVEGVAAPIGLSWHVIMLAQALVFTLLNK